MVDLDKEEIKKGINKCYNNSKSLLDDADYLFEGNRIARAYAIYILCIEEIQKTFILFRILLEKEINKNFTKEEKEYYSKFFSSHTFKIKASAMLNSNYNDFADRHSLKKVKTSKEIRNDFLNPRQKDTFKQQGFYVSLVHKKFKEPEELVKVEKCKNIQNEAKLNLSQLSDFKKMFFSNPDFFIKKYMNNDF
jgi:AbiV family abortive infection protein